MLQITEDTPPDMLTGAMDLTIHLPTGRAVKISVERSTPMMDLLVQITTRHHLTLCNYTLQPLQMESSSEVSDKILPYKPNTPIGTLDTQHVRVVSKSRTLPVPKNIPPGHQPFESTFRLKVHLPRNQLYVTRVSRNILLEDIMKEVCQEKNLNPGKYEFKHRANLDEVLDPKLALSDYQITEIYLVLKGTTNFNQTFSNSDIMVLRKEEERKQMHHKTGGGVFNLIFRRGKSSMGSGSISSDARSISPSRSDDSRSLTPPNSQKISAPSPPKKDPPPERPKPPQRKRRPAPKPPLPEEASSSILEEKPSENLSGDNEAQLRQSESGITICHSRNSSDSSGYHEASVLSENASLPRRTKSAFITPTDVEQLSKMHSQSTTNLSKMSPHSKSTVSLGVTGRKKRAAPPPPPLIRASNPSIGIETPSPVVASQPVKYTPAIQEIVVKSYPNPRPAPRTRLKIPTQSIPVHEQINMDDISAVHKEALEVPAKHISMLEDHEIDQNFLMIELDMNESEVDCTSNSQKKYTFSEIEVSKYLKDYSFEKTALLEFPQNNLILEGVLNGDKIECTGKKHLEEETLECGNSEDEIVETVPKNICKKEKNRDVYHTNKNIFSHIESSEDDKLPAVIAMIPKISKENGKCSKRATFRKQQSEIIPFSGLEDLSTKNKSLVNSVSVQEPATFVDELSNLNENVFDGAPVNNSHYTNDVFNQLYGIHDLQVEERYKKISVTSLRSLNSSSDILMSGSGLRKWDNVEDLDDEALAYWGPNNRWVVGESSQPDSLVSQQALDSLLIAPYTRSVTGIENNESKCFGSTDSGIAQETLDKLCHTDEHSQPITPPPPPLLTDDLLCITDTSVAVSDDISIKSNPKLTKDASIAEIVTNSPANKVTHDINIKEPLEVNKLVKNNPLKVLGNTQLLTKNINLPELVVQINDVSDLDWQYQLPSPPKDFRDSSPVDFTGKSNTKSPSINDFKDSVVTSPELFEKLKIIEDFQSERETISSEITSIISEEDKPLFNTLSLENLEKRKSLVYNRELATSLKMTDNIVDNEIKNETFSSSLTKFETAYVEMQKSSQQKRSKDQKLVRNSSNTLPNFKISTYDRPKLKIKVFEDDTIRSNTENNTVNQRLDETDCLGTALKKSCIGRSMENLPFIMKTIDSTSSFQKENNVFSEDYVPVSRSDSFSTENVCTPLRPVLRSKSHITINANRFKNNSKDDHVSRSNSLYDVSGLQSLGVMRLIQNKLNSPVSSSEKLHTSAPQKNHQINYSKEHLKTTVPKPDLVDKQKKTISEKTYKYQGPPSINMGTWSDRPKVPVTVKEDADYKLGNNISSKLIVNSTYNNVISNNTLEVKRNNFSTTKEELNGINKGNDANSINKEPPNVVIKIGTQNPKIISNQRFFGHTTATGYRKPLTNINTNRPTQRPHSIAFDSDFDISRVPVVKSVEFKKSFKDNTSVTKINQDDIFDPNIPQEPVSQVNNKFSTIIRNSETPTSAIILNKNGKDKNEELKSVLRTNSLKYQMAPVVRGFDTRNNNNTIGNNSYPWNSTNIMSTNKLKEKDNFTTNVHVPFSQSNLRKTDSSRIIDRNIYNKKLKEENSQENVIDTFHSLPSVNHNTISNIKPPPPPPLLMSKVNLKPTIVKPLEPIMDQRDQLLSAIRTFGGKKGLKSVKAS